MKGRRQTRATGKEGRQSASNIWSFGTPRKEVDFWVKQKKENSKKRCAGKVATEEVEYKPERDE